MKYKILHTGSIYDLFLLLGVLVFWALRSSYWLNTFELPFSDMDQYERIARNILYNKNFTLSQFWQSYRLPVTPLLRAIQIQFFGEGFITWRIFLAFLTCSSLLWAVFEIEKTVKSNLLAISLLWIVAISKSSIFWSFKLATEGVAEMLTYLSIAGALLALRKKDFLSFFLAGVIFSATFLNRAEHVITPILFIFLFFACECLNKRIRDLVDLRKVLILVFATVLGVMLVWSPWLIRSFYLYGEVCPFTTNAARSFSWEISPLHNEICKKSFKKNFSNDYEYCKNSNKLCQAWVRNHYRSFGKIYLERMGRSVLDPTITLTQVSRDQLFQNSLNRLLIDKNIFLVVGGVIGMIVLIFLYSSYFYIIPIITFIPWMLSLLVGGSPRFLEPFLPVILFSNTGVVVMLIRGLKKINIDNVSRKQSLNESHNAMISLRSF